MSKAIQGAAMLTGAVGMGALAFFNPALVASPLFDKVWSSLIVGGIGMEVSAIGSALTSNRGMTISTRQAAGFRQIIYGTQRVGGTIVYQSTTGSSHDQYNFVVVFAGHEVDAIENLYLDGRKIYWQGSGDGYTVRNGVGFGGIADSNDHVGPGGVTYNFGGTGHSGIYCEARYGDQLPGDVIGALTANDPAWATSGANSPWLGGCTYIYLKLEYSQTNFPSLPEIKATIRGKNNIYDPRVTQAGISYVGGASSFAYGTSLSQSFAAANTEGNCLIVDVGIIEPFTGFGTASVSDSQGNYYTALIDDNTTGLDQTWVALNCKAGPNTVTVTYTPGSYTYGEIGRGDNPGVPISVLLHEYSNVNTVDAYGFSAVDTPTVDPTVSVTSTTANDIIHACVGGAMRGATSLGESASWTAREFIYGSDPTGSPGLASFNTLAVAPGTYTNSVTVQGGSAVGLNIRLLALSPKLGGGTGSTTTSGYTSNWALVVADVITNTQFGLGDAGSINTDQLIAAANICDEMVPLPQGGSERRYDCHWHTDTATAPGDMLQTMMSAAAGRLSRIGGEWFIWPAAWLGPSFSFDQSIMTGPIQWTPTRSFRELINRVTGTYIAANYPYNDAGNLYDSNGWYDGTIQNTFPFAFQPTNYPTYAEDELHGFAGDAYLAEDGGVFLPQEIAQSCVLSIAQAQRVAKIYLRRNRQQGTGTFSMHLAAWQMQPCTIFQQTFEGLGWSDKLLEATAVRFRVEEVNNVPSVQVDFDVAETDPSVYESALTDVLSVYDVPVGLSQPPTSPSPATSLTLSSNQATGVTGVDGIFTPRIKASWVTPADAAIITMDVQYQLAGSDSWIDSQRVNASTTSVFIAGVVGGQTYNVRIAGYRSNGAQSAWTQTNGCLVPAISSTIATPPVTDFLTDGLDNFIFANGDTVTVIEVAA